MSNHRLTGDTFTGCVARSKRYIACRQAMLILFISTWKETPDDPSSSNGQSRQQEGLIRLVRDTYYISMYKSDTNHRVDRRGSLPFRLLARLRFCFIIMLK